MDLRGGDERRRFGAADYVRKGEQHQTKKPAAASAGRPVARMRSRDRLTVVAAAGFSRFSRAAQTPFNISQEWPCVSRRESIQEERGQTTAESGRHAGTRERSTLAGSAGSPQCNFARLVHLLPPRGLLPGVSSCHSLRL
jgi:hypothetical protein